MDDKAKEKFLLGFGRACDFTAPLGRELCEEGPRVFAYPTDFFCVCCDGCGCKSCNRTGEEAERVRLKAARSRGKAQRKAARERKAREPWASQTS